MLLGPEQADLAVRTPEGLQPIEDGLSVVQHRARRIEAERSVGLDARVIPALLLLKVGHEHVVGEHGPEGQLAVLRLGLAGGGQAGADRVSHERLSPSLRSVRICVR